jgi:predicted Zn-dependent peptidase
VFHVRLRFPGPGLIALALAFAPGLDAQAGRIMYDTFNLANGLHVMYSLDRSTPVVSVDLWYRVGARNERPGRGGFAHLFEHMMFQGSAHVKKGEHFQLIERAGGNMNGSTGDDRTNYFETLPSNRLNLALWLEADRMRSLAITQENFENQRETVKEERRLRIDNQPYIGAFLDGLTIAYDSTSCFAYGHPGIGSMDDLNAGKLADVQAFFDAYYAPNNATLVVVGDFDPVELRRLVEQYFGDIGRRPEPPAVSCDFRFAPGAIRREVTDRLANLPAVLRLYRIPPHRQADTRALVLMNIILGQGESSRLNQAVVRRDKAALVTQVFATEDRNGPGILAALGIANQGVAVERLDSLLVAQLDSLARHGVTDAELGKAKNTYRAQFIDGRETTLNKAEALQHYLLFHDAVAEINTDLDAILGVTAADIQRVAATYLAEANAVIMIVRPAAGPQPQTGGVP